jgi:hypothetical protein
MRPANDILSASKEHTDWLPLLEISAREVFELMLGCQLRILLESDQLAVQPVEVLVTFLQKVFNDVGIAHRSGSSNRKSRG